MAFPQTILGIKVELLINGSWSDISTYVYHRDNQSIFYGRGDESSSIQPANMKLTLNNRDQRFSPKNTTGAYYPYLGRNTQIRYSINDTALGGTSFSGFMFWGEVSSWPPQQDISGNDQYVQIDAGGILQRYQQGGLIGSVMKRYYLKTLAGTAKAPIAYWSCEDQSNATQFLSPISGVGPMTWTGSPNLASDSNYPGSDPIPLVNSSTWTGTTGAINQSPTTYTTAGTFFYVAPFTGNLGVDLWGADAGGSGGTASLGGPGGGAGEYGGSSGYPVIQGNVYKVTIGAAGRGGVTNNPGSAGGDTDFDDGGLKAQGGQPAAAGSGTGGLGGNLATAPIHFKGGNGGSVTSTGGSGGGGRAGTTGAGGNGTNASGTTGTAGGNAGTGTGGGSGGTGGNNAANGNTASAPGGGGGGAGHGTSGLQQTKTYNVTSTVDYYGTDVGGGKKNTNGLVAQGVPNTGNGSFPGNQFGFAVLPSATIVSDWSGWTITDNTFTVTNQNSWYSTGAYLILGWTTRTSFGANITAFTSADHWSQVAYWNTKGVVNTHNIFGTGIAAAFTAGTAKAMLIGPSYPYSDLYNYGVWNGGANSMQLTIVGTKGGTGNFQAGSGNDGRVVLTPPAPVVTSVAVRFLLDIPATGAVNSGVFVHADLSATQFIQSMEVYYGTGGKLGFRGATTGGSPVWDSGLLAVTADGRDLIVSMELVKSGANTVWTINVTRIGSPTIFFTDSGTVTSELFATVTDVTVNPTGTITDTGIGHITVQYNSFDTLSTLALYMNGFVGETAADRFTRLCLEEGIASTVSGVAVDTPLMGPQRDGKFTDVLQTIEDADRGQLFERRDALGLGYRTRRDLCDQLTVLALDNSLNQLAVSITPTPDDQLTRNDVNISRTGGSAYLSQLTTGALSMNTPPNGVGDYTFSLDVPIHDDTQLQDLSNWVLSVGTVDEYRYPDITVDLTRPEVATLFGSTLSTGIGDFIALSNLNQVPGGSAKQLAFGITDTINNLTLTREFNGVPESPYETVLNQNPYFVAGLDGWESVNGSNSIITPPAGGPSGLRYASALQYVNGGVSVGAAEDSDNPFAVAVLSPYQVFAWVRSSVTTVDIGVDWLDSTFTFISTSVTSITVVASTWTRITSGLITSPINAVHAYARVGVHTASGTIAMMAVVAIAGSDIW